MHTAVKLSQQHWHSHMTDTVNRMLSCNAQHYVSGCLSRINKQVMRSSLSESGPHLVCQICNDPWFHQWKPAVNSPLKTETPIHKLEKRIYYALSITPSNPYVQWPTFSPMETSHQLTAAPVLKPLALTQKKGFIMHCPLHNNSKWPLKQNAALLSRLGIWQTPILFLAVG